MGDLFLTHEVAQGILELHQLNKEIVFRIKIFLVHGALKIERKPLLDAAHPHPLGEVHKEHQIENDRRRKNAVPASAPITFFAKLRPLIDPR